MKITASAGELADALALAAALSDDARVRRIQSLGAIRLTACRSLLEIAANVLDHALTLTVPATVETAGALALPGDGSPPWRPGALLIGRSKSVPTTPARVSSAAARAFDFPSFRRTSCRRARARCRDRPRRAGARGSAEAVRAAAVRGRDRPDALLPERNFSTRRRRRPGGGRHRRAPALPRCHPRCGRALAGQRAHRPARGGQDHPQAAGR